MKAWWKSWGLILLVCLIGLSCAGFMAWCQISAGSQRDILINGDSRHSLTPLPSWNIALADASQYYNLVGPDVTLSFRAEALRDTPIVILSKIGDPMPCGKYDLSDVSSIHLVTRFTGKYLDYRCRLPRLSDNTVALLYVPWASGQQMYVLIY